MSPQPQHRQVTPTSTGPRPWRLVAGDGAPGDDDGVPIPADGPTNMALDRALLEAVADGAPPVLRLYRWSPATLSFGRNQPARGLYDEAEAGTRGIRFVRRPTGGQAVLHDDELTYAVVAPVSLIGKPRAAYGRINEALVAGLGSLGLPASLAGHGQGQGRVAPEWRAACFRRPARGEVVAAGRKLVGSAQRVEGRTVLQHGSILVGGSQAAAEELLVEPASSVDGTGWTTLERELGERPSLGALVEALVAGFGRVFGTGLARSRLEPSEEAAARELQARFASDGWTWRR